MCEILDVSRSGYYEYLKRLEQGETDRERIYKKIDERIHFHFFDNYMCYGSPRIHQALLGEGICISERTVGKRMKRHGLRADGSIQSVPTTNSDHDLPVYENHLDRKFDVDAPDKVWVTDITYVRTDTGFLYLNAIMDLFGRKILSYRIYDHMKTELCLNALREAVILRQPTEGLVHHSDRGSQYCSNKYTSELKGIGAVISMSRKATPHDNACMESFFATLKKELVYRHKFKTKDEAITAIKGYIHFYNTKRKHSTLDYMTPNQKEMSYKLSQHKELGLLPLTSS